MRREMQTKILRNQRGSSLLIVAMILASAFVSAFVVMQNNANVAKIYAQRGAAQAADNLTQLMSTLMADPNVCMQGFDGSGLKFLDAGGAPSTFDMSLASS